MPWHTDLAQAFRGGPSSGVLPPGLTAQVPDEAGQRFDVYRNNVAHSLTEALGQRFPVVKRLVGEAFFRAMARVFIEAHPPASPVLLAWGEALPEFLERFPPVCGLPYLPDVARLEFARGRAFHAADATPLPTDEMARLAREPETARLGLHPSVRLLASRFAVVAIWRANQPGGAPRAIKGGRPETALVLRDRAFEVRVRAVGAGDAAFMANLQGRETLLACASAAARAEPGHDPGPLLALLVQAGAFTCRDTENPP